jgi:hypothetical protein
MSPLTLDILGLFILLAGFVIGLGAVTVIDLHGFLGRRSGYWTRATTQTHKVTKPLIWIGFIFAFVGGFIFYREQGLEGVVLIHLISFALMILNGLFLSFKVSPFLIQREKEGRAEELLPSSWQTKITISFVISFICWWGNLFLLTLYIVSKF